MNAITRPEPSEYAEYFETYISLFTPTDFWAEFDAQPDRLRTLLGSLPAGVEACLLYTSPSPRDKRQSRMPSSA